MWLRRIALFLPLAVAASAAAAEDIRVIGDSIGEGVHLVANVPSPANRFNVAIYTPHILRQIDEMPRGATVFMSLGTNDAVAHMLNVKKRVAAILAAAEAQGIKLYWLGPPCVLKPWEADAKKLDEILAAELAGGSATYVSLQDGFCAPSLHEPDGVHFTMAGYRRMWQIAAAKAGVPVVVAAASEHRVGVHEGKKTPAKGSRKKKTPRAPPRATPKTLTPH